MDDPVKALHDLMIEIINTPPDPSATPAPPGRVSEAIRLFKEIVARQCPSLFVVPGVGLRGCSRDNGHDGKCGYRLTLKEQGREN